MDDVRDIRTDARRSHATGEIIVSVHTAHGTSFLLEVTAELEAAATRARQLLALVDTVERRSRPTGDTLRAWRAAAAADEQRLVQLLAQFHDLMTESQDV